MKKLFFITIAILFVNAIHAQVTFSQQTSFSGFIGKYEIRMILAIQTGGMTSCFFVGEYYYKNNKDKMRLCADEEGRVIESINGKETGYFIFNEDWDKKVGQTLTGHWYSLLNGNRDYPVVLKVIGKLKD
jgi:hypothetical protein